MGALRTLLNHQKRDQGAGRYGRKRTRREPFGTTRVVSVEFGHLKMIHPTKGFRWRGMTENLYNSLVLAVQRAYAIDTQGFATMDDALRAKCSEYFGLVMENARNQARERRYPLV